MLLLKNDHFSLPSGARYALLSDKPEQDVAYVINVEQKNALPEKLSLYWLYENATLLDNEVEQHQRARTLQFASKASLAQRDRAWSLIRPLVKNANIFNESLRWKLICDRAAEVPCAQSTLLIHLRRYWQGGQAADALLGKFKNCGLFDADRHNVSGRPSTKPGRANFIAAKEDHQHYRTAIEQFYLKDEIKTVSDTLQYLWRRFYTFVDGNGEIHIKSPAFRPTRRQLEHFLHKNYPLAQRLRSRKGAKAFEKDHRQVLGTIDDECLGVGHIYEMDATIVDVSLVSSLNRRDIIGRPTLYYLIDRYSRLIVGWYIGLENPCWTAAVQAILSISEDKQVLCKRLGITYNVEDWPAHRVMPQNIFADRGETMSREATSLCSSVSTVIVNLPSCRPDWKPLVEGSFRMTHQAIADTVPGYNPAWNAGKRRATDYSLNAGLTLKEFESNLVMAIIVHNNEVRGNYNMTPHQLAKDIEPSPINIWNHGVTLRTGEVTRHSEESLRLALLPSSNAIVSEQGIKVNGCYYRPESLDKSDWFVEGRRGRTTVTVSFDRRRADQIYVHDPSESAGYFIAKLTTRSEKYAGMSISEVSWAIKLEERLKSGSIDSRAQGRLKFHQHANPIVDNAKRLTAEARKGTPKSGRRRNIKEAREFERNLERDGLVDIPESPNSIDTSSTPGLNNSSLETKLRFSKLRQHSSVFRAAGIVEDDSVRDSTVVTPDNVVSLRPKTPPAQADTRPDASEAIATNPAEPEHSEPQQRPLTSREIAQRARQNMHPNQD